MYRKQSLQPYIGTRFRRMPHLQTLSFIKQFQHQFRNQYILTGHSSCIEYWNLWLWYYFSKIVWLKYIFYGFHVINITIWKSSPSIEFHQVRSIVKEWKFDFLVSAEVHHEILLRKLRFEYWCTELWNQRQSCLILKFFLVQISHMQSNLLFWQALYQPLVSLVYLHQRRWYVGNWSSMEGLSIVE